MTYSPVIGRLMEALRCLPGVGPKSAQRMTFYLLERNRKGAMLLADTLREAVEKVGHCHSCRTLSETEMCPLCSNQRRDHSLLCIVESPADAQAIEASAVYRGLYFVLMGRLSPLDGIGPEDIGLDLLARRLNREDIKEVILATNPTVEGEATAHCTSEMLQAHNIKTTRIAHGVPIGGELEYIDSTTLTHAFTGRQEI